MTTATREHYLFPNVSIAASEKLFYLVHQIPSHFFRCNVREDAQRKSNNIHIVVIHVTFHARISLIAQQPTSDEKTYFFSELVTRVNTSCFSSNSTPTP